MIHAAPGLIGYSISENKKLYDGDLRFPIKQQKHQICPYYKGFRQQKILNDYLSKNQKLNKLNLAQNNKQKTENIGIGASSSITAKLKNSPIKKNLILNNAIHLIKNDSKPLKHSINNMSALLSANILKQENSYLSFNEVNNIKNKSIFSIDFISETDFDEIDENVASEICAREKKLFQLL